MYYGNQSPFAPRCQCHVMAMQPTVQHCSVNMRSTRRNWQVTVRSILKAPDCRKDGLNIKLEFILYSKHKTGLPLFAVSVCCWIYSYWLADCADSRCIKNLKFINDRLKSRELFGFPLYEVKRIGPCADYCSLPWTNIFRAQLMVKDKTFWDSLFFGLN